MSIWYIPVSATVFLNWVLPLVLLRHLKTFKYIWSCFKLFDTSERSQGLVPWLVIQVVLRANCSCATHFICSTIKSFKCIQHMANGLWNTFIEARDHETHVQSSCSCSPFSSMLLELHFLVNANSVILKTEDKVAVQVL